MLRLCKIVCLIPILIAMIGCGPEPPPIIIPNTNPSNPGDTSLITVTELPALIIPEDNPLTVSGVDLGKHLFYDNILSGDQTQSCATCHNQKNAFSDNGLRVSEGIRGDSGDRNAMVLFNLMWSSANFWDSRAANLRELATMPIENPIEMDAKLPDVLDRLNQSVMYLSKFKDAFDTDTIKEEHLAKAIEQFLLTITSDNSKFDKFNRGEVKLTAQELRGFETLKVKGCFNCHSTTLMHDDISHNTGLDRVPADLGLGGFTAKATDDFKFKTPSLRNVMVSSPYMHDGRFRTIEEVIRFYEEDVQFSSRNITLEFLQIAPRNRLTTEDMADVTAFLHSLTDQKFLDDPRYKDPF
jgi:cytochrome c peroxidase